MNIKKIIAGGLAAGALSAGLGMVVTAAPASAKTCSDVVDAINSEEGYSPTPGEKWACASVIIGDKWTGYPQRLADKWTGYPAQLEEKWTSFPDNLAKKWSGEDIGGAWKDGVKPGGYANGKGGGAWSHTGD